jgi:hypothetical protein
MSYPEKRSLLISASMSKHVEKPKMGDNLGYFREKQGNFNKEVVEGLFQIRHE